MAIGNFRRMEEIGRGSFATVYKAMHVVSRHLLCSVIDKLASTCASLHMLLQPFLPIPIVEVPDDVLGVEPMLTSPLGNRREAAM